VVIIDWYSRYVLSWILSISLTSDFCVEALKEVLSTHQKPHIFNTDQGVQFTSQEFIKVLSVWMGKRALDNVFIEGFWRSL